MASVEQPNRSEWTSQHEWRDPDCIECGGEGAPCCEPPDHPYTGPVTHALHYRPAYTGFAHLGFPDSDPTWWCDCGGWRFVAQGPADTPAKAHRAFDAHVKGASDGER